MNEWLLYLIKQKIISSFQFGHGSFSLKKKSIISTFYLVEKICNKVSLLQVCPKCGIQRDLIIN